MNRAERLRAMDPRSVAERSADADARNWGAHLERVTGGPRPAVVRVVSAKTTTGQPVKRSLWSALN